MALELKSFDIEAFFPRQFAPRRLVDVLGDKESSRIFNGVRDELSEWRVFVALPDSCHVTFHVEPLDGTVFRECLGTCCVGGQDIVLVLEIWLFAIVNELHESDLLCNPLLYVMADVILEPQLITCTPFEGHHNSPSN